MRIRAVSESTFYNADPCRFGSLSGSGTPENCIKHKSITCSLVSLEDFPVESKKIADFIKFSVIINLNVPFKCNK